MHPALTVVMVAFRNLLQAKRRTLLLSIAIALVAALFLTLRAVSGSVSERMVESATTLSAGHVNIGGFSKTRKKGADPVLASRDEIRAFAKEHVPEAISIIDRNRGWGRVVGPASSINVGLSGIVYEEEQRFFESLRLAPGSEYKQGAGDAVNGRFEDMKKPNSALIFSGQAKKLGVVVGDTLTVRTEASGGQSNTVDLTVAAIVSDIGFMSNWSIFVPRQTILDLYRLANTSTGVVMVYLESPDTALAVMERLREALKAKGHQVMDHDPKPFWMKFDKVMGEDWLGQKFDLTIWSDEISFVLWVTVALDFVSFFVVGVLAIIIIGGITNSIWMSVRERTKEIGTMRAIGTKQRFILQLFLLEAAMLGFFASLVGVILGGTAIAAVNAAKIPITNDGVRLFLMANTMRFDLGAGQVASTLLLFSMITGFAAIYPAFKAARLRPVDALMQSK